MNLSELKKFLDYTEKKINPIMEGLLSLYVDKENKETVYYQISTGGKRLRPALAIACCNMLGGIEEDVLYPAASLEILHNYSLIIDDIIDNSALRRKKPTFWFKFGKSIADIIGIDYASALFEGTNRSKKSKEVSEILSRAMKNLTDGEILDVLFEKTGREDEPFVRKNRYKKITEKDYFKMVSKKTAELIKASCEIGALMANASKRESELLINYGFNLGMAFQVQDDILDIFGTEKLFGKEIGKDIIESKRGNIVILYSLKELSVPDKKMFLEILNKRNKTKKEVKTAIQLIKKTKGFSKATSLKKDFIQKAKRNLSFFPKNQWNKILKTIADFVIKRAR